MINSYLQRTCWLLSCHHQSQRSCWTPRRWTPRQWWALPLPLTQSLEPRKILADGMPAQKKYLSDCRRRKTAADHPPLLDRTGDAPCCCAEFANGRRYFQRLSQIAVIFTATEEQLFLCPIKFLLTAAPGSFRQLMATPLI